jgi:hypothetical protein
MKENAGLALRFFSLSVRLPVIPAVLKPESSLLNTL